MSNNYNEDYYERGVQLGISGYSDYRWLPELTLPMCRRMVEFLDIKKSHKILDFGCAKGFITRGFNELGYDCYGTDISEYALSKAEKSIKDRLILFEGVESLQELSPGKFNHTIAKDVFEHIAPDQLEVILQMLASVSDKIFCVVPLGANGKYIAPEMESDITHVVREDLNWWSDLLNNNGFKVDYTSYRVPGVKDNWAHYGRGNGFFVATSCHNAQRT